MFTVRHDIKLSVYPLLSGLSTTRAASLRLAALTDDLSVWAVRCYAIVMFGATREHAFHVSDLPKAEGLGMFPQNLLSSAILFEQEFGCSWDKLFRGMSAMSITPSVLSQVKT